MTLSTDGTLVLIAIVAVVSPILAEFTGRLAIPDVVTWLAGDTPAGTGSGVSTASFCSVSAIARELTETGAHATGGQAEAG